MRASVKAIMIIAGSASEANIISRLEPIPPKLVPTSMPTSARKKRAEPSSAVIAMRSADPAELQASGKCRNQRRGYPGGGEDHVGTAAEQPGRVLGEYDLLADQPQQIAVGLKKRRPAPAQQARLDLARIAEQQRRQHEHQDHLRTLRDEFEDQDHISITSIRTNRRPTRTAKTRLRNWRMVRNCR